VVNGTHCREFSVKLAEDSMKNDEMLLKLKIVVLKQRLNNYPCGVPKHG
jgi:hypothetical protein